MKCLDIVVSHCTVLLFIACQIRHCHSGIDLTHAYLYLYILMFACLYRYAKPGMQCFQDLIVNWKATL